MSSSPSDINTQILPSAEVTDKEKFHAGWREWAIRNLLLGAQPENVVEAMMQSGFSRPFAAQKIHEYNFEKHKTRMQMKEYVRLVEEGGETNDYYMVAQNYLMSRPEFQTLYGHIDGLDGYLDPATLRGRVRFWFGPKGTITQLHHDATPVMMGQIFGCNNVKLVSPLTFSSMNNDGDWIIPVDPEMVIYPGFQRW